MDVSLHHVKLSELEIYHKLQVLGFKDLYQRYQDHETSPVNRSLLHLVERYQRPSVTFYFIQLGEEKIGGLGLYHERGSKQAKIGPIFIAPACHHQGYGAQAMLKIEELYPNVKTWYLDTIAEESKLLHFYQKLGYQLTGASSLIQAGMTNVDLIKK